MGWSTTLFDLTCLSNISGADALTFLISHLSWEETVSSTTPPQPIILVASTDDNVAIIGLAQNRVQVPAYLVSNLCHIICTMKTLRRCLNPDSRRSRS
ncbi:hypothetical protein EDB84DRAFT_1552306 [Lactarius hengduanensis]|nr:hypothetical protein EDB84DRAFT_1552306 [Lactarius hengduanensis]